MNLSNTESLESNKSKEKSVQSDSELNDHNLKELDPDKFVESYGPYGRYQILTYILVQTLNFFYSSSMYVMSYVQLAFKKECKYKNETVSVSQTCHIEDRTLNENISFLRNSLCGDFPNTSLIIKDHSAESNLLIDFGLECSHWVFQEFGLTVFTIGAVATVPIMSWAADKYGRRPIIIISSIVALLANIAAAFSPNYTVFLIFRAIVGAASDTYLSVGSVATCEYISEKARAWITVVYNVAWAFGMLWTVAASFITEDWRYRYLMVIAPGIYAFSLICLLPESPHWLITKNKTKGLKKYIKISNRINKTEPNFSLCKGTEHHEENNESIIALCESSEMLWILFVNGYIEFVISLVYFAISFLSVEVGEDNFTVFLYSSLVEIPAGLVVLPLMIYFGRKSIVFWSLLIQTISLVFSTIFMDHYTLNLIGMMTAKIMATIIYTVHPIWANEQFPTSVRSLSFSLMNIPQSVGIIISPYFKHIVVEPLWIPFLIIAILSFISTVLSCFLKETMNMKMPTDVRSLSRSDLSKISNEGTLESHDEKEPLVDSRKSRISESLEMK